MRVDLTDGLAVVVPQPGENVLNVKDSVFLGAADGQVVYLIAHDQQGLVRLRDRINEVLKCD